MKLKHSDKYGVDLNVDNFEKREQLVGVCLEFAKRCGGSIDHVIPCIKTINELDSNFPFDLITSDYLCFISNASGKIRLTSKSLLYNIIILKKIYSPSDYHDILSVFKALSLANIIMEKNKIINIDSRFLKLLDNYNKAHDNALNDLFKYDVLIVSSFKYIYDAMLADAWVSGLDDYSFIKEKVDSLRENFDVDEFIYLRGLWQNTIEGDFVSVEAATEQIDAVFDYVYQYLKENGNAPVIK